MNGFKAGGIVFAVSIVLFFLTPFFPFDDLIAFIIGVILIAKELMK